jgi:hypothetical protein
VSESITVSANQGLTESLLGDLAAEAVEVVGVRNVIATAADTIFAQIEDCEAFASGSPDADAIFIATSLPVANAVIHYRTSRAQLAQARTWARERWPDEKDPTVALATLTLIYIIGEGWKRYSMIAEKREVWARIRGRVASVVEESPAASPTTAAAPPALTASER